MSTETELERLGLVPSKVRDHVIERDASCCRICGQYVEHPALHHIRFRSQGGLDIPSNLVVVGWQPGHDCHLQIAHGANARYWRDVLLEIAEHPELTGLQVTRWRAAAGEPVPRRGPGSPPPR